ncbi:hypothetical protein CEXT_583571 [Caerostris extrusa]|uniref:Eclosion hormone n=1 Tax=Caerostris extrusa TaxID=172846 RepID=A0AAV4NQK3_CAEEX|nr:hypothetical protein CEXT_583571 [Caerostris extrusa]
MSNVLANSFPTFGRNACQKGEVSLLLSKLWKLFITAKSLAGNIEQTMLHVTGILFLFLLLHTVHESCARSATWMCINNCAQCKRTYGAFFEGQRCAESCIKYRGPSDAGLQRHQHHIRLPQQVGIVIRDLF